MANNLAYDNLAAGVTSSEDGAGTDSACKDNRIYFNTVISERSRGYPGVKLGAGGTGNELLNNVIFWSGGSALETESPVLSNYNCLGGAPTVNEGSLAAWQTATGNDLNSSEGDPLLDAEFRLLPDSPAVDGAVTLAGIDVDRDGTLRPHGANPDRGCYETVESRGEVVTPDPPAAPRGLQAVAGDNRVDLRWEGVIGPLAGYCVYRSRSGESPYLQVHGAPVTVTAYSDLGLPNGDTFWYRVCALDLRGSYSLLTDPVSATPTTPEGRTYPVIGRVMFDGSGLAGVTVSGGDETALTRTDGTYTLRGLAAGTYTLRASKGGYSVEPRSTTVGPDRTGINFVATVPPAQVQGEAIYLDALRTGWRSKSHRAVASLRETQPVEQGARSVSLTIKGKNGYVLLSGGAIALQEGAVLTLAVHGGETGGQDLRLRVRSSRKYGRAVRLNDYGGAPAAGSWTEYRIPLADLGVGAGKLTAIKLFSPSAEGQLFLDEIRVE